MSWSSNVLLVRFAGAAVALLSFAGLQMVEKVVASSKGDWRVPEEQGEGWETLSFQGWKGKLQATCSAPTSPWSPSGPVGGRRWESLVPALRGSITGALGGFR